MFKILIISLAFLAIGCTTQQEDVNILPVPEISADLDDFSTAMLAEVNALRTKGCRCGNENMPAVTPLTFNQNLTSAADSHARDMHRNDFFDHRGSDGDKVADRSTKAGYSWRTIGENIALHPGDLAAVVAGWQDSPGHCKNMMNADYKDLGAARSGNYWVQVFGRAAGE